MSARLHTLLPRAQLRRIEGCGHMGPVQSPEVISPSLREATM
jgi:pimeloyl-ACP methyl ester carboxylesterase